MLEAHTFHKAASAGSRCINCHMSDVNWRLLDSAARSHVPGAGAGDDRRLWRAERLHHVSRQSLARMGGATDGSVVGRRRAPAGGVVAGRHDVPRGFGRRDASCPISRGWRSIDRRALLVRASAVEFMEQLALGTAGAGSADAQSQTSFGAGARQRRKALDISPRR